MGCDIHAHTEIKVNGRWEHYRAPCISRDYALFSMMAGVRTWAGAPDPIAEPRGLPEDASVTTKLDSESYGKDGHTHSWLSLTEMEAVERFFFGGLFGFFFGDWVGDRAGWPSAVEDARVVFWFDN